MPSRTVVRRRDSAATKRPAGRPLLAAGLALALGLGACSNGSDESTPATPIPSADDTGGGSATGTGGEADPIAYESPGAEDVNLLLPSTEGLVDARAAAILNVEGTGGTELIVAFEMESHYCYGVNAQADESETEVVLSIETGVLPDVDPTSCRYGVYPYTTAVTLADPLGERTITTAVREPTVAAAQPGSTDSIQPEPEADDDPTPRPGGEPGDDEQVATTVPPAGDPTAPSPIERGGPATAIDDAAQLIGQRVEDGVEWAITNDVEWRVLSYDGETVAEDGSFDPTRLSLVVDRDLIVHFEWS